MSWEPLSAAAAAGGLLAAAAIWWVYFGFLDSAAVVEGGVTRGLTLTYSHFLVYSGIAALGVGVKVAILSSGGQAKYDDTVWVFCAGLTLCMLGMAVIDLATPPMLLAFDFWLRLGTAALALVFVPVSFALHPLLVVWLLAGALVGQVVLEIARHEHHSPVDLDV